MARGNIKQIKNHKTGDNIWPETVVDAVRYPDGVKLSEKLDGTLRDVEAVKTQATVAAAGARAAAGTASKAAETATSAAGQAKGAAATANTAAGKSESAAAAANNAAAKANGAASSANEAAGKATTAATGANNAAAAANTAAGSANSAASAANSAAAAATQAAGKVDDAIADIDPLLTDNLPLVLIGEEGTDGAEDTSFEVITTAPQELTRAQKKQVQENIGLDENIVTERLSVMDEDGESVSFDARRDDDGAQVFWVDGSDGAVRMRGIEEPARNNDAANKEYVDKSIAKEILHVYDSGDDITDYVSSLSDLKKYSVIKIGIDSTIIPNGNTKGWMVNYEGDWYVGNDMAGFGGVSFDALLRYLIANNTPLEGGGGMTDLGGKVTELERKVDDLEKRPVVDETLTKRVANLEDVNRENKEAFIENMDNLGDVRVKSVDMDELPKVSGYPLFIFGSGAPTVAPDFVPQFYIDTTGHKIYIADGTANASSFRILN